MTKPIRVLHVVGQLEPGGVATWLNSFLKYVDHAKMQVDIVCNFRKTAGVLADDFRLRGFKVFHIAMGSNILSYMKVVRKFCLLHTYDIVHDHRSYLAGSTLRAACMAHVPVRIVYHHGPDDGHIKGFVRVAYHKLFKYWTKKYATDIWGCSNATLTGQYGLNWLAQDSRCKVVYGAIVPPDFSPVGRQRVRQEFGIPLTTKVIGFICRITQHKNPLTALNIALKIMEKNASIWFVVVGDGPLLGEMRRISQSSDVSERIKFTGFRQDIPDVLQAIDLFLQPSLSEGFPLGTLEALHAGLPVVASAIPGILEALPQELHYRCSKPNDIDAHIEKASSALAASNKKSIPTEFLMKFTAQEMYSTIYQVYLEMLQKNRAPHICK